jgi:hypothetical protein
MGDSLPCRRQKYKVAIQQNCFCLNLSLVHCATKNIIQLVIKIMNRNLYLSLFITMHLF